LHLLILSKKALRHSTEYSDVGIQNDVQKLVLKIGLLNPFFTSFNPVQLRFAGFPKTASYQSWQIAATVQKSKKN